MGARAKSVLFLAPERLRPGLTGPSRRTLKLAEVVGEHCEVSIGSTSAPAHLADVARHDVTVTQTVPSPRLLLALRRAARCLVVDMIAPLALEVAETAADGAGRDRLVRWRTREMLDHLAAADLVLCTNEKQRDLLIGAALASGLLRTGAAERALHERIAVVPHGIDADPPPPRRGPGPLRAAGVAPRDGKIALWAGGLWSWLDPFTAIRAVESLRPARPDLTLVFAGFEHPDPAYRDAHDSRLAEAARYVRDRDLGAAVLFRPRWLPREEYVDHLLDADVGVVLHGSALEGRFASRTRVLDYLHAGLPTVCSGGDTMSALVTAHDLGEAVAPLDVAGCARALDRLTGPGARRVDARAALEPLLWPNAARPLVEYCLDPWHASHPAPVAVAARAYPVFLRALHASAGTRALARGALRRAAGRRSG